VEPPAALRQPEFRSLWLAGLVSDAGDWMLLIALPIVVYGLTGSALGTSGAFIAELAPAVVLAPLAGRLADRLDRRRLMLTITVLQALALAPLLAVHSRAQLPILYAVIVAQASLATIFEPAKNALLPTLLAPSQLVSANSLIALNGALGRLAGGPLGGLLLAAGDLKTIVIADALSFLVAAGLIWRLPPGPAVAASEGTGPPRDPAASARRHRSGWPLRSLLADARVRAGLLVAFIAEIAQGIFVVLFILFVARRLHGGSGEIGLLRGVQAIGAIGGGLALSVMARPWAPGALIAAAALAFGAADLMIWNGSAVTTAPALYAGLFVLAGAPGVVLETGLVSLFQLAVPDGSRGRIFGALGMVSSSGQAIGMLAAGILTPQLGLMTLLNAQGLLYLVAGALAARFLAGTDAARAVSRPSRRVASERP
jgi:MFS family permease